MTTEDFQYTKDSVAALEAYIRQRLFKLAEESGGLTYTKETEQRVAAIISEILQRKDQ